MSPLRRLLPRQFTDWQGKYMLEDDPKERWRECRVVDISTAGAGLELLDTTLEETTGQRILLAVHLRGELRNVVPARNDGLRAGIQFVGLTQAESDYLESLAELQTTW
jgi:hypothetical protein